jgi:MFS family permease
MRAGGFWLLLVGDTISQFGSQISRIALPLAALIVLNASPFQIGLLAAAGTVALVAVGLPAGALVDRTRKRPVLISADLARAALLLTVPLAGVAGVLTLPQLYFVALATGVATVFFDIAYQSYVPLLLPRADLMGGNTKLATIRSGSEVAGPGIGGVLVRVLTAPIAVAVDALSFLASAICLWRIVPAEPAPVRRERRGLVGEVREGFAFLMRERIFLSVALTAGLGNLWDAAWVAVAPVFLIRDLGASPAMYGGLLAAGSVGGLVGAAAAGRLSRRLGEARYFMVAAAAAGASFCLVPLTGPAGRLGFLVAGTFGMHFALAGAGVAAVTFRQTSCPPALLGRVTATKRLLIWGLTPVGGVLGGVLAQSFGPRAAVAVSAIGMLTAALPAILSPMRRMRDFGDAPLAQPN